MLPGATEALKSAASSATPPTGGPIESTFDIIRGIINEDIVKSTQAVYQFNLTGNARK